MPGSLVIVTGMDFKPCNVLTLGICNGRPCLSPTHAQYTQRARPALTPQHQRLVCRIHLEHERPPAQESHVAQSRRRACADTYTGGAAGSAEWCRRCAGRCGFRHTALPAAVLRLTGHWSACYCCVSCLVLPYPAPPCPAQPRPAQPRPGQPSPAQPSPAPPSPATPRPASPSLVLPSLPFPPLPCPFLPCAS